MYLGPLFRQQCQMLSVKDNDKGVGRQRETKAATLPHPDNAIVSEKISIQSQLLVLCNTRIRFWPQRQKSVIFNSGLKQLDVRDHQGHADVTPLTT